MAEPTIASVTPTICRLLGIEPDPFLARPMKPLMERAKVLGVDPIQKVLIYAPDAIGLHLCNAYPECIDPVVREASVAVRLRSVVPSVTPVCFATMFTGEDPSVHGIRKYEKPVVRVQTLFDRLIRAGKKVAIIAVRNSSIDRIFRGRQLDYFSEKYDPQVTERALQLLEANSHDLLLVYHQEYDDTMHRTGPQAEPALEAFRNHISSFVRLAQTFNQCWRAYDRLIGFTPDHGAHLDVQTGQGTHGLDTPEDIEVQHFYGLFPGGAA